MNLYEFFRAFNRMTPSTNYSFATSVDDLLPDDIPFLKDINWRMPSSNSRQDTIKKLLKQSKTLVHKLSYKVLNVNAMWDRSYKGQQNLLKKEFELGQTEHEIRGLIREKRQEIQNLREKKAKFGEMKLKLEESKHIIDLSNSQIDESNSALEKRIQGLPSRQTLLEEDLVKIHTLKDEKEQFAHVLYGIDDRIRAKREVISEYRKANIRRKQRRDLLSSRSFVGRRQELEELSQILESRHAEICKEITTSDHTIFEMNKQIDQIINRN